MSKAQLNQKLKQIYEQPGEKLKYMAKYNLLSATLKH